jgi:hypothetical protein
MCSKKLCTWPVITHRPEGLEPAELGSCNRSEAIRQKNSDTIQRRYDPPLDQAQQCKQYQHPWCQPPYRMLSRQKAPLCIRYLYSYPTFSILFGTLQWLQMKRPCPSETSGSTQPATQCHNPEDLSPQKPSHKNFKPILQMFLSLSLSLTHASMHTSMHAHTHAHNYKIWNVYAMLIKKK